MAVAGLKLVFKPNLHRRPTPVQCVRKVLPRVVAAVEAETLINKECSGSIREEGYDAYLVGGCVRDLILKQTPKDFDIITSAELKEVMRTFSWCEIVGKSFPRCHVHMDGTIIEVSSFNTSAGHKLGMEYSHDTEAPNGCDKKDCLRWMHCLEQDFTTNGSMFDPYARIVYDYMGGLEDIRKAKVRTVIPAATSFQEDCAYGSGEASLRLLWKFGLLDILLPFQAAYFVHHGFRRRDKRTNMLLSFFSNLDKLLAPHLPCHSSLWVGILALHKSLSDQPRDPLVVAAFSFGVHNGGNLLEAVSIARMINKPHDVRFPELLDPSGLDAEALGVEILDLAESVRGTSLQMTNEYFVSQAMADYPQAPHSDLVFIPLGLYLKAFSIFDCESEFFQEFFVKARQKN